MAHSARVATMIALIVEDLNATNYDEMARKAIALPVTTRTHLNHIAGTIHARALARPTRVVLYAKLCATLITGGFDGARPGSGKAFQSALLPKCYDKIEETCTAITAATQFEQPPHASVRQTDYFVTNCDFIAELYNLGVYPDVIVWSFVNDLLNGPRCGVQVRCLCALVTQVAPKLSKSNAMTIDMALKMKTSVDELKETYWTDWFQEHPDRTAEQRPLLVNEECSLEPSRSDDNLKTSEFIHVHALEILLKMTNDQFPVESYDIERLLTPVLLSALERDPANLIDSLNRAAFTNGGDQMCTVAGVFMADLVNAGRIIKYAVMKGFHLTLNDKEVRELHPDVPDLLQKIRNAFEDRLVGANPVNETVYQTKQTSQWLDCDPNKTMINVEFSELLTKFESNIHFKEPNDIVRILRPVLLCILKQGQVNTVLSLNYTAIHTNEETVLVNAGKLLGRTVLARRLRKTSVIKGFCKILIDDASSEYFTNIRELVATIRTAFESEL